MYRRTRHQTGAAELPGMIIAVVGGVDSGKSQLIRHITGAEDVLDKDKLESSG